MKRLALLTLRLYKLAVSPYMPGTCRFEPTCSEYASQAVERFGAAHGTLIAARRLGRCHPFGARGLDPVPDALTKAPADAGPPAVPPAAIAGAVRPEA